MDDNKFFKGIWRFNALAIFLAIVILSGIFLVEFFSYYLRDEPTPTPVINLADDPDEKELWKLGNATKINGTDFVLMPLSHKIMSLKQIQILKL